MLVVDVDAINKKLADIVGRRGELNEQIAQASKELRLSTRKRNFYRCKFLLPIIEGMKHIDYISSQFVKSLESEYHEIHDPDDQFPEVDNPFTEVRRLSDANRELKKKEASLVELEAKLKDEEVDLINARNWWLAKSEAYESSTSKNSFEFEAAMRQGIEEIARKVCNFDTYFSVSSQT